jgi:hypothetical protein
VSRLESFIRRMEAQRILLNYAAGLVTSVPGPILELGLGSGRTYDHLREILPDRPIFVFDSQLTGERDQIPDRHHMIRGNIRQTLRFCLPRIGARAAMVHNDIATGHAVNDTALAAWLTPLVREVTGPNGLIVTSFTMDLDGFDKLALPEELPPDRYHIYRNRS